MAKYKVETQYKLGANQGDGRKAQPLYIIAHESGNPSDTKSINAVDNEAKYMKNNYQNAYSTHWVGGGGRVLLIGEPGYVSWAALNANPYAPGQVELARTADKATFKKDYAAYVTLLRDLAKRFNIPLTLDKGGVGTKGIKTHRWVTNNYGGDHVDPVDYLKSWGISQAQFAKDIANGIDEGDEPQYYTTGSQFKVIAGRLNGYKDIAFKTKTGKSLSKGTIFSADVVKYGDITRLKANGVYYSSNKDNVAKVK